MIKVWVFQEKRIILNMYVLIRRLQNIQNKTEETEGINKIHIMIINTTCQDL